jgi:hypothetical protein
MKICRIQVIHCIVVLCGVHANTGVEYFGFVDLGVRYYGAVDTGAVGRHSIVLRTSLLASRYMDLRRISTFVKPSLFFFE